MSNRVVRGGFMPAPFSLKILVAVGASFALAACAQTRTYNGPVADGSMSHVQPAHMPRMEKPHVPEMEDDGLPVQTAPLRRKKRFADDPTEPFSPNYGPSAPVSPQDASFDDDGGFDAGRPQKRWAPIAAGRQDDVIMQAMSAHERRYP
ncbi:MAG: hypothetical protein AAFV26_06675 [Pseudomonadota bacterium]